MKPPAVVKPKRICELRWSRVGTRVLINNHTHLTLMLVWRALRDDPVDPASITVTTFRSCFAR